MPEQSHGVDAAALDEALTELWSCLQTIQECVELASLELARTGALKETHPDGAYGTKAKAAGMRIRELRGLHEPRGPQAAKSSLWQLWRAAMNCVGMQANCVAALANPSISEDDRAVLIESLNEERLKITSVQVRLVNERMSLLATAVFARR